MLLTQLVETHLIQPGAPLKSAGRKIRCVKAWPCKRVAHCPPCASRRRTYFIYRASKYSRNNRLDWFMTVSWPLQRGEEVWNKLHRYRTLLASKFWGVGKYIRVHGIGERETPHLHFVLGHDSGDNLRTFARQSGPPETVVHREKISDLEGVLGYLYDQNFMVLMRRTDRPRRIRLISGSKGLSCGFPPRSFVQHLEEWEEA